MSVIAKGGRIVTEDMEDRWADEIERGELGGIAGPVFPGPVFDVEPVSPVSRTVSLSPDMSAMLDTLAKKRGVSADAIMRHALIREFAAM
ncbi:CopG family transcriptional regulator [Bifidobacterium simiarum]|uniref:Uncharacterized protein n=1 Tax=Bifidobacterium simiarum TaxID=2045441 RepID=A0A2M9HD71_9BIFI|nr:CopG family transcriptional regulator [Bifidobacterium simiarum]PJM74764.1 hypothetical protein CSQ87_08525 [Bifidobacterium simiarum]